jgi:hypothetical protein
MANDQILDEHRKAWHGFVWLIGLSAGGALLILALMGIFLT